MAYAWFVWSLLILGVWSGIFIFRDSMRKEMLAMSLWTMLLGLTEPLFVPSYWNPPSLFNLAQRTGFDIESLIFTFAIGGIGSVVYKIAVPGREQTVGKDERSHRRHRMHKYTFAVPVIVFLPMILFTGLNPIYCGVAAMFLGSLAALYCRPDLKRKIWVGGILFTLLYFIFFTSLRLLYPEYVQLVWNFRNISGIQVFGVPLEEYMFAFSFGMLWSSLYEHLKWYRLVPAKPGS